MSNWHSSQIDRDIAAMRVKMWDIGPKKPVEPKKPVAPEGPEGTPKYKLAVADFEAALATWQADVAAYAVAKRQYDEWQVKFGGPFELDMASVDARDALTRDPERYVISNPKKPNNGLPRGMKPGHAHEENERRRAAELADFHELRKTDPAYGGLYT